MRGKMTTLLLALALVLCLAPVAGAEDSGWSENVNDMTVFLNQGANYIRGVGMGDEPSRSTLFANDQGGVTFVQYLQGARQAVVTEFDGELQFQRTRKLDLQMVTGDKWCGFLAGTDYYYIFYSTGKTTLRVLQYEKDWTLRMQNSISVGNTKVFPHDDFDVVQAGSHIVIATNHQMSNAHEANLRLELDAGTLALTASQSGVADYTGYVSHAYVPEVVYNGGTLYIFDRGDSFPDAGLWLSTYAGGLSNATGFRMLSVDYFDWRNWGNIGNAIPAGGGVLAALNQAPYDMNLPQSGVLNCNAYLYYSGAGGQVLKVSNEGNVGTPLVGAVDENHGYILWNTEIYSSDLPGDDLTYIPWTITDGKLTAGEPQTIHNTYLSDAEPISWEGGLLWCVTKGTGVINFYHLTENGVEEILNHEHDWHDWGSVEPTCVEDGISKLHCRLCGAVTTETLPALGHDLVYEEEVPFDCVNGGVKAHYDCRHCSLYFMDAEGQEELSKEDILIPATGSHSLDEGVVLSAPDCRTDTDGVTRYTCTVCGAVEEVTVPSSTTHVLSHVDAMEATCTKDGCREHYHCSLCGRDYYNEAGTAFAKPVIPALGHKYYEVTSKKATETEPGWYRHYRCSRCHCYFIRVGNEYRMVDPIIVRDQPLNGWLLGDVDLDGTITLGDPVTFFAALSRRNYVVDEIEDEYIADVSMDGIVNIRDALLLFRQITKDK